MILKRERVVVHAPHAHIECCAKHVRIYQGTNLEPKTTLESRLLRNKQSLPTRGSGAISRKDHGG